MKFITVFDEIGPYLWDIEDSTPLSREREVELSARIKAGDMAARNELVQANLRFVVSVANKYQNCGLTLTELISAGNVGLITAAERFDGERGFKFISYAVWWIRQAIQLALADESRTVRVPASKYQMFLDISKSSARLRQRGVLNPRIQDIADDLHTREEEVVLAITSSRPIRSLDGSYPRSSRGRASDMGEDDAIPLETFADESAEPPDEAVGRRDLREQIAQAVTSLDSRDAQVLRLYYGLDGQEPMTLEAIGGRLGLTRERVRQLKERVLHHLRCHARAGLLAPLIEGNEAARLDALAELQGKYKKARKKAEKADAARKKGRSGLGARQPRKRRRTSVKR